MSPAIPLMARALPLSNAEIESLAPLAATDPAAAERVIQGCLPRARALSMKYFSLDPEDALAVAIEAYAKALSLFKPCRGIPFLAYATTYASYALNAAAWKAPTVRIPQSLFEKGRYANVQSLDAKRFEDGDADGYDNEPDPAPDPFEAAASDEAREAVRAAVATLPHRQREAVSLYYGLSGMPQLCYSGVGAALGCTSARAQQIVALALASLRHRVRL